MAILGITSNQFCSIKGNFSNVNEGTPHSFFEQVWANRRNAGWGTFYTSLLLANDKPRWYHFLQRIIDRNNNAPPWTR